MLVLNELEDNPQIVTGATCPRSSQFALQLVCLQRRLKCISSKRFESCLQTSADVGILLHQSSSCSLEDRRRQKDTPHFRISRISSSGVAGTQRPAANSWRAS